MPLFDPRAHDSLVETPWNAAAAEAAIRAIVDDAEAALRPDGAWWPLHPLDCEPGDPEVFHGLYLGAAGMAWGLRQLGAAAPPGVLESYRRRPELRRSEPAHGRGRDRARRLVGGAFASAREPAVRTDGAAGR